MLKQLRLNIQLKELRNQLNDFISKNELFKKREAELEKALDEANSQEDMEFVSGQIDELDKEVKEADCDGNIKTLNERIEKIEKELDEIGKSEPEEKPVENSSDKNERKDTNMKTVRGIFGKLSEERRTAVLEDTGVKEFLERVRSFKGEKRSISGGDLLIPNVILGMVKENVSSYSKLLSKVTRIPVSGTSRRAVAGAIPEAVWTEMTGAINELSIDFSAIETDGFKVAGYFAIDNSLLEDNDAELLGILIEYLSASVGLALDKAIVYGTGYKMPLGFVTRLAQSSQPADWSSRGPAWTDLHTSNILKYNLSESTGESFFATLMEAFAVPNPKKNGANNSMFWVLNRKTHMDIIAKTIKFNSAAALVAQQNSTMPIIGGEIIELEFMADYDIAGGFGAVYNVMERAGFALAQSSDVKFIEDQTVVRGIGRYDGKPVYAEGFVIFNYANINPTTTSSFAGDSANGDRVALSSLQIGATAATLFPCPFNKDVLNYHCTVTAHSQKITAAALDSGATVVIKNGSTTVNSGSNATFTAGENTLTVTVTNGNSTARTYTVVVIDETA